MWFGYSLWTHASARLANRSAASVSNVAGVVVCATAILPITKRKNTVQIGYFMTDTLDELRPPPPIRSQRPVAARAFPLVLRRQRRNQRLLEVRAVTEVCGRCPSAFGTHNHQSVGLRHV